MSKNLLQSTRVCRSLPRLLWMPVRRVNIDSAKNRLQVNFCSLEICRRIEEWSANSTTISQSFHAFQTTK
ncbi:hypothetical protein B4U80_07104 [Leptotrombidium deliense]|uniref:Uncharacterized protein n=1 Tax=Leptotrombidium deliense TaxID=299467 RepID=A0A443SB30_9ACAR|nr:hypothetical protein B4U80_07104 [Leptotrombidium deliense]